MQANILEGQEIFDRVFIEDLSRETIELELETRFWSIGEVVDVRIVCDRKTGLNKGCGQGATTTDGGTSGKLSVCQDE